MSELTDFQGKAGQQARGRLEGEDPRLQPLCRQKEHRKRAREWGEWICFNVDTDGNWVRTRLALGD